MIILCNIINEKINEIFDNAHKQRYILLTKKEFQLRLIDVEQESWYFDTDLRFYCIFLSTIVVQPFDIQFAIKMSYVANDSVLQHFLKHISSNNVLATSGSDKDTCTWKGIFNGCHFKSCLKNNVFKIIDFAIIICILISLLYCFIE